MLPLAIVGDAAMIDHRSGSLWLRTYHKCSTMLLNLDPRSTVVKKPMRPCLTRLLPEVAQPSHRRLALGSRLLVWGHQKSCVGNSRRERARLQRG